jgi:hypothetical protein
MGATYRETGIKAANEAKLRVAYAALVAEEAYEYGHGGYTGTFAEKASVRIIPPPDGKKRWSIKAAREHCDDNDKWGSAWAYRLGAGKWYVGGYCPE